MSTYSEFFAQNKRKPANIKFVVSKNFVDATTGVPKEWEIRQITPNENERLLNAATKKIPTRGGAYQKEVDNMKYVQSLTAACVVYPNLKDKELQDAYNVVGEVALLKEMLTIGELGRLNQKVQEFNDLDLEDNINELVEEAKN